MNFRAFPGSSGMRELRDTYGYGIFSDDEDSQVEAFAGHEGNRASANEGKGKGKEIAASSVEMKTNKASAGQEGNGGSANEGKDIAASSVELKTYERRNRLSASKRKAIAVSPVELKTYYRRISDYQKLQFANNYFKAAYLEIMTMAKEAGTWVRLKPALGNLDDLVSEFRNPTLPGKKLEFSIATSVIPNISASEMAIMMMNVSKDWSKSLFPFVKCGEQYIPIRTLQHLSNTDASIRGVVEVYAELQLPTTFVPTRYFDFLRYWKEIMKGVYIIVDFSSHYFGCSSVKCNSEKRPSGVIIRECGHQDQDCEIICIENVEVDETRENMYSSIINLNLAFCANRWISTLLWKLKRDTSKFVDVKIDVHVRAGSYLLDLTQSMKHFFMECVCQHPDESLLSVSTRGEDEIRLLHNKTVEQCLGYVGLTSFRVQAKPLSVFQFLMKKDLQLEFRPFANSETFEEPEQLFKFATDDNSNTISLHRKKMGEENVYCLQEASRDEYCSFIISKPMSEDHVNFHIVSGVQSIYDQSEDRLADITASGFSIMPDGPGGLQCNGSLITFLVQLQYDPTAGPVPLDFVRDDFLNDLNDIIRELNEEVVGKNV